MAFIRSARAFSVLSRISNIARVVEHPFEHLPPNATRAKADWGLQARHLGNTALLYVISLKT